MIQNALSIDVEDYFQVSAFGEKIPQSEWSTRECRIERNIRRILELLRVGDVKATFFTLGWIADRYPELICEIASEGHEIASHGYNHNRVSDLTPAEFREDIVRTKGTLENLTGHIVTGYRAPSFSISEKNLWAFDIIQDAGYKYSSSIYPINHDHYGMPSAPRFAHKVAEQLLEVPISTTVLFRRNFPASGGGYFRLLPYYLSKFAFSRVNAQDKQALVFYFHPWEIDVGQPIIGGIGVRSHFRHYVNLAGMERKLVRLFSDFRWGRMDKIFLYS